MKINAITLNIDMMEVAAKLAHCDADVQGQFFNVFIKELQLVCETSYKAEKQMLAASDNMNKETKEAFEIVTYKGDDKK